MNFMRCRVLLVCCSLIISLILTGCEESRSPQKIEQPDFTGADVVVLTVIAAEFEAMLAHMDRVYPISVPAGYANTFAWTGAEIDPRMGGEPLKLVVGLVGEAGNVPGALAAVQAVELWDPAVLVLAGIAGGLPPNIERGDVLISTAVWGYEYGAVSGVFDPRLDWLFRPDFRLVQMAAEFSEPWQEEIQVERPVAGHPPKQLTGVTASGNKVIETLDSNYVTAVLARYPDIASVEMEATGVFAAARLMQERSGSPEVVMFRGISDKPNPHSGTLGDKNERDHWKDYAADSVASFTVSFLRHNHQQQNLKPTKPVFNVDALLVTYSPTVFDTLKSEMRTISETPTNNFIEHYISRKNGEADLKVVVGYFAERGNSDELHTALGRFKPAAVLLVDTALGVGKSQSGDVVMARLVWPYGLKDNQVKPLFSEGWRGARSLVVSAQAIEGDWKVKMGTEAKLKSGTIAAGAELPDWDNDFIIGAVASLNPRTAMIDDDSFWIARELFNQSGSVHFLSIQASSGVAGTANKDESLAGQRAAKAALMLLENRWPYETLKP